MFLPKVKDFLPNSSFFPQNLPKVEFLGKKPLNYPDFLSFGPNVEKKPGFLYIFSLVYKKCSRFGDYVHPLLAFKGQGFVK